METLERRLQWNLVIQVVLGAGLLSGTDGGDWLLPVALVGALVSLTIVDGWRLFYLGRLASNLVALVVAFYPLFDFFNKHNEAQLLSIAQLLVNLQVVLLLERKTSRIYWQIFVLSVLQVVVASALRFDLQGGLMYLAYAVIAASAMVLMLAQRDLDRIQTARTQAQRRRDDTERLLEGEHPEAILRSKPVMVSESVAISPRTLQAFHGRALSLTVMAIVFSSVLFYMIPRAGEPWMNRRTAKRGEIGFTDRLEFDETTQLQESDTPVLRVSYEDPALRRNVEINGGIYLRGTTLHYYDVDRGQPKWLESRTTRDGVLENASDRGLRAISSSAVGYLKQTIVMPPSSERYLFTDFPCFFIDRADNRIAYDRIRNAIALSRFDDQSNEQLKYDLAVTSFSQVGTAAAPIYRRNRFYEYRSLNRSIRDMSWGERQVMLQVPPATDLGNRFPTLSALAWEWTKEIDQEDHFDMMLAMEQALRSGEFKYTLDFRQFKRDESIDPIEDFVANRRAGHCEYFASTLALMLRLRGIPARIVVGYHAAGSEFNELGGFYDVRMRNTHAWVEAYLAPENLPPQLQETPGINEAGCWVHLDPTPAGEESDQADNQSLINQADQAFGYAQMIWDDYVVGLDSKKQNESFGGTLRGLFDVASFEYALERAFANSSSTAPVLGLIAILVVVVVVNSVLRAKRSRRVIVRLLGKRGSLFLRRIAPALARWIGVRSDGQNYPTIPFYQQLEAILLRHGIERLPAETPVEFGRRIESELQGRCEVSIITPIVAALVRDFYAVRYGGQPLDLLMRQRAEASLDQLASALEKKTDAIPVPQA